MKNFQRKLRTLLFQVIASGAIFVLWTATALALQSGGVEIGDLETGSVVGTPFNQLQVDIELTALCLGGQKAWYSPTNILNLQVQGTGGRAGRPILIKLTNNLPIPQGVAVSADGPFAGPTSMNFKIIVKPGNPKYVGIPLSDLTYVTASSVINYGSHIDPNMLGGQLLIMR